MSDKHKDTAAEVEARELKDEELERVNGGALTAYNPRVHPADFNPQPDPPG
jgi:hypothetical protein